MIAFNIIRELHEKRQWSQKQMTEQLGMSKNGYAKIERGESSPNLERLQQIANALGVNWIDLLQLQGKNIVVQTQNQNANYHYNHYCNGELHTEIEKLKLIILHKDEIIA